MTDPSMTTSDGVSPANALDYHRDVAKRLSVTARKLRLATSNRSSLFKAVGLRPRVIDRVFSAAVVALTILFLIGPNASSILYYGFLANDQYESETRFTVRSSTPALGKDQLAKVTGLPSAKIVQDTQIVTNYVSSGEMLAALSKTMDIRRLYGDTSIDFFARLKSDASSEDLLEYWKRMVSTGVSASSGIVTVKVRAFSADEARAVLRAVVAQSEAVVNDVNARIWKDVISTSRTNLENAASQLQAARERLQETRTKAGVLNVEGTSMLITSLISNVQQEMLDLQQRYDSNIGTVSKDAPQMRVLQREMASKQRQIDDLKAQLAGQRKGNRNLADVSLDMSQLELEQGLAERQFAVAVKTLEQVQFVSKQQLIYLDTFLAPTLPDEAEYPRRHFWIGCILVLSLVGWGVSLGLLSVLRSRLN